MLVAPYPLLKHLLACIATATHFLSFLLPGLVILLLPGCAEASSCVCCMLHTRAYAALCLSCCCCCCCCCQVGAEELAPEEYKAASELRVRLTSAARVKQQLEAALRGLAPGRQQLDEAAEPVEAAIKEAAR
jgi:hypothetical protein